VQFHDRALADGRTIRVCVTERVDGDFAVDGESNALEARRRVIVDRPWVWLHQVHGADVVLVDAEADPISVGGRDADAVVTTRGDVALAVQSADCGAIALWTDDGAIAAVHAGWRGIEGGAIDATVAALGRLSAAPVRGFVGPCIGVECYEFGVADLDRLRARFGDDVVATTSWGTPALDVRKCIARSIDALDVEIVGSEPACTACESDRFWSHRARADRQRQALVIWIDEP
jgi:YfiH family protein